jgi:ferritin
MKKPIKLPEEIVKLLLPRLKDEFDAAYLYRSISNWCQGVGYFKAAEFFAHESEEEFKHAAGIEKYLVDWNVIVNLPKIEIPSSEFTDLVAALDKAYVIEYKLYEEYEDTSMKVFKTGDLCTFDFLQHYRTIQRLAVAEYSDKLNMLEGVNPKDKINLLLLEKKLFA